MRALGASRTSLVPGGVLAGPWVRDDLWRRARAVPSLDLRFADNKSLVDAVTGASLVTFTRASNSTFVNSAGVLQTAVTNLLLRSEEFDNASWIKTNSGVVAPVVTANQIIAPDGTNTADKIDLPNMTGTYSVIYQTPTQAPTTQHTLSCYLRGAVGGEKVWLMWTPNGSTYARTECALTTSWQRFSLTYTTTTGAQFVQIGVDRRDGMQTAEPAQTVYTWGAQLEQSATVGEYIPTTSTISSTPRFDHNPTTGESLGLLVEESRTNLLLQSENFGTTWTANGLLAFGSGSTLNALAAPDGQTTADLITENTSNSQHNVNQVSTTTGAKRFSVFAKQGPGARLLRLIDFNATDGAQGETYFNLSTGAVVSGPGAIQAFPNGWYRCSIQSTTTVTSTYFISIATSASAFTYTGDGTSGIYLWGAQLEAGAFPTSYIPTTTAAVTRSADLASITGSAFSGFYRQDEGTIYHQGRTPTAANFFSIDDGTANNRITSYMISATAPALFVQTGGVAQANLSGSAITAGSLFAQANAYKAADFAIAVNGGTVSTTGTGSVPVVSKMVIGANVNGTAAVNGTIKRLCFWPQRLGNQVLQNITQ